ncbi:MAG TPA: amidase, partial [Lautropia sp.]|nr:amidase [Lautropia sp.]
MSSIIENLALLSAGKTSTRALVEQAKAAAQAHSALNALAWVDWALAEETAALMDEQRAANSSGTQARLGPLHGIPITIKDLYHVRGTPLHAGTRAVLPDLG